MSLMLKSIRVLDLTRVLAGPFCTQILGDYGAEILKIEKPGVGDDTRSWGPPFLSGKASTCSESAYFLAVNRSKKSVAVDFRHQKGREIIQRLAKKCDVLVENYVPGKLAKYGLDYDSLKEENPELIYVSLTGYGPDGPYASHAGYDVVIEGEAGLMSVTGDPQSPPSKVGVAITDISTGLFAHGAILAALFHRSQGFGGQKIDVSLINCQVACLANLASNFLIAGIDGKRLGTSHSSIVPYQAFETLEKDGYFLIGAGNDNQFKILCQILDLSDLSDDPRFRDNAMRVANRSILIPKLQERFKMKSSKSWSAIFKESGIPHGPVNSISETFSHPQIIHNQLVKHLNHPKLGTVPVVGNPLKFSSFEPAYDIPPPMLGEHTEDVLQHYIGMDMNEISQLEKLQIIQTAKK